MVAADSSEREIWERYQKLYASGHLSLSKNYSDKYPLLDYLLQDFVRQRTVLDFGCGPGRLTLMLARYAREVHGVDYVDEGVDLARFLARAAGFPNVRFFRGDLEWVTAQGRSYEVIVLAGVLEHIEQPLAQLGALTRLLEPGGLICIQSPSFANFRGDVYNTLRVLIGLPMSLTDLWQVTPKSLEEAAPNLGLRLEKVVGGHYRLAFLDRVVEDLRHRVPAAARDAGEGEKWDFEGFYAWLSERAQQNRWLVDAWVALGMLKPIPACSRLPAMRPEGIDDATWASLEEYLTYDGWREPWYSDVPPVCHYGGSAVYFLRKDADSS